MTSMWVDGILYIPVVVEGLDFIGDGMVPIEKTHPKYEYWAGLANMEGRSEDISFIHR